jgi:predicted  nucleic acid-binding Zn-ribbon protein
MQFTFTNYYSTLLEKVRLGYKIRVIPPSVEAINLGRRRRTKSSLDFLESEISSQRDILETATMRAADLNQDVMRLQNDIDEKIAEIESILAEEGRLKKVLDSATSGPPLPKNKVTRRVNSNKFLNEY